MSGDLTKCSASIRADEKTKSKEFSPLQKLLVVGAVITTLGGIWFFISAQAALKVDFTLSPTRVAKTLTTNPQLEQGLVAWWTFDGSKINLAAPAAEILDSSDNGNTGDWQNHASTTRVGVMGQALYFDGSDDYVYTVANSSIDNLGPLTLALWIKPVRSTNLALIGNGYLGPGNQTWAMSIDGNGSLYFSRSGASDMLFRWSALYSFTANEWQHVVATWTGGTDGFNSVRLYRNGAELGYQSSQNVTSIGSDAGKHITIGDVDGVGEPPFEGVMDDVRIYNRVLTQDEITRLYGLGATTRVGVTLPSAANDSGLVGHWTFDGKDVDWASGIAEIKDSSGNGNHGDAQNGMSTQSATPGVIGQGMGFDGDNDAVRVGGAGDFESFPMSVATWVNFNTLPSAQSNPKLIQKGHPSADPWTSWTIGGSPVNNKLSFIPYDAFGAPYRVSSDKPVVANRWYHVAATIDDVGFVALYIDGVQQTNTETLPSMLNGDGQLEFGNNSFNNNAFRGALDDVRIYNRALSAEEINRLYQLGK